MLVTTEKCYMVAALYKNNILQPTELLFIIKTTLQSIFNKKNTDAKCWEKITLA